MIGSVKSGVGAQEAHRPGSDTGVVHVGSKPRFGAHRARFSISGFDISGSTARRLVVRAGVTGAGQHVHQAAEVGGRQVRLGQAFTMRPVVSGVGSTRAVQPCSPRERSGRQERAVGGGAKTC